MTTGWFGLTRKHVIMKFENPLANPYFILFSLLFLSVAGSTWIAKQWKVSSPNLDYAQAIPAIATVKESPSSSQDSVSVPAVYSFEGRGGLEVWHRYHAHILPIAVGFFMLTLSGWSLLGVENLAMREIR